MGRVWRGGKVGWVCRGGKVGWVWRGGKVGRVWREGKVGWMWRGFETSSGVLGLDERLKGPKEKHLENVITASQGT